MNKVYKQDMKRISHPGTSENSINVGKLKVDQAMKDTIRLEKSAQFGVPSYLPKRVTMLKLPDISNQKTAELLQQSTMLHDSELSSRDSENDNQA